MSLLSLNEDALLLLVSFLSSQDALRLSETSRKVHLIGIQQALSSVTLTMPHQLPLLHKFLLCPSAGHHILFLRHLRTRWNVWGVNARPDFSNIALLADILEQALRLKSVCLHIFDELIKAEPRILSALVALDGLENVEGIRTRSFTLESLHRFRSGLKKLRLCFADEYFYGGVQLARPASYFGQLSVLRELEDLDLHNLRITYDEPASQYTVQPYAGPRWPAIRHLTLSTVSIPAPLLAYAFPNVEHAALDNVAITDVAALQWITPEDTTRMHAAPVHSIDLDATYGYSLYGLKDWHVDVLRTMSPFLLSVTAAPLMDSWPELIQLAPRLKYLYARLNTGQMLITESQSNLVQKWLDTVPALLPSGVICVRVYVQDPGQYWHDEIRDKVFNAVPSVWYIAAQSVHYREDSPESDVIWWRVDRTADTRRLVEISREAGAGVHAYLHSGEFEKRVRDDDASIPVFG
ncbi:hypothetical protein SCP_1402390 [Sparassis crispa]|uniref:F-box domain-containing protein n=1 Tax=Sparassis crispa TaxID=139825 RepID=A0A401H356_9APHY|nr:hypothetical protein SCP_1402390 [Sparassis crispa]GBE88832.1 hypothetical protein SCP_1402390 [Sparassis crispa]